MEKIKNLISGHHSGEEASQLSDTVSQPTTTATHDGQVAGTHAPYDTARDQTSTSSHIPGKLSSNVHVPGSSTTASQNVGILETDPVAKKHEHSVLRQIVNPGGDKYDQEGYGSTVQPHGEHGGAPFKAPVVADDVILRTDDGVKKHEHSVLRQILNPGGAKYDQEGFGTTAHAVSDLPASEQNKLETTPAAQKTEHGVLRQILNPGGEKYDSQAYGVNADTVGHAAGVPGVAGTGASAVHGDNASATSIKSGVRGPYDQDSATLGSTSHSHAERDGTFAGTAAAAGGVAAVRAHKPEDDTPLAVNPIGDDVAVAGTGVTHGQAVQNQFSEPAAQISHVTTAGNTHHGALAGTGPTSINPIGDDISTVGTGVSHGQAVQSQYGTQSNPSQVAPVAAVRNLQNETSSGLAQGQAFPRQYSGYIHHTQGPHPTDAGNIYDPSVPGSFPQAHDQTLTTGSSGLVENRNPATGNLASSAGTAAALYGTDNSLDSKTEQKLQQAREEVAAEGGDRGEKKPSLIQRILHPGQKSHETHGHEHAHHSHETPSSGPLLESRTAPEDISHGSIGPK